MNLRSDYWSIRKLTLIKRYWSTFIFKCILYYLCYMSIFLSIVIPESITSIGVSLVGLKSFGSIGQSVESCLHLQVLLILFHI